MKTTILLWTPRVLAIIAILFVMMFSFDVFGGNEPIHKQLIGFLVHNIPAFVLMVVLAIAWKREFVGGILFILLGLSLSPFVFMINYKMNNSISMSLGIILLITFPFVVVGILFILNHYMTQRRMQKN
jgi:hypothetical protein